MLNEINEFLTKLENEFPYSTMHSGFRGHHSIYKDDYGTLQLQLWSNERAFTIPLNGNYSDAVYKVLNMLNTSTRRDKNGRFKKELDKNIKSDMMLKVETKK